VRYDEGRREVVGLTLIGLRSRLVGVCPAPTGRQRLRASSRLVRRPSQVIPSAPAERSWRMRPGLLPFICLFGMLDCLVRTDSSVTGLLSVAARHR